MRKRSGAGSLSERVAFLEQVEGDDGYGGVVLGYVPKFEDAARLEPRMGSEPVVASRLQGIQPYTMTVRSSVATRAVTPAWRVRNKRTGREYAIKTCANPDERGHWIEMLVIENEAG